MEKWIIMLNMKTGEHYFQKDKHLRELEREAFEQGNLIFRDWSEENEQNTLTEHRMKNPEDIVREKLKEKENKDTVETHFEERSMRLNKRLVEKYTKDLKKKEKEEDFE